MHSSGSLSGAGELLLFTIPRKCPFEKAVRLQFGLQFNQNFAIRLEEYQKVPALRNLGTLNCGFSI
ncbi:CIC11C00000003345 [Sungouiella intermedia]|uniref:CIC11C00000003345 n=1 Tax=Sungouiella intermedia TaxID=45354 RepID=A0A1L0DW15_9ASCO|nr:CIC11C00000003345 [[Candida] intermedia]